MTILNKGQRNAYNYMIKGFNLFLTGSGGVGKSTLIKYFVHKNKHKRIGVTSTTGVSAVAIGGSTIHSYLGLGCGDFSLDHMCNSIMKNYKAKYNWLKTEILIIDEISMLSCELFDKLNILGQAIRNNDKPFGGIQIILSGDFCQLSPVGSKKFCFESECWSKVIDKIVHLKKIVRQDDKKLRKLLDNIRFGIVDEEIKNVFNSRIGINIENKYNIIPTKLYSKNVNVDMINSIELNKLAKNTKKYNFEFTYKNNTNYDINKNIKNLNFVRTLELCVGCQVMLLVNLDVKRGLVNGSRGIITKFVDGIQLVKFLNGEDILVDRHKWDIMDNEKLIGSVSQIPLRLGYALTIHKSQGSTLDLVQVNLSDVFEYGMVYVALSRIKSLDGLIIESIDYNKIKCNPKVKQFYLDF